MDPTSQPQAPGDGTVRVQSFLDRSRDAVLARGRFGALFDAYLTHAKGLGPLPAETGLEVMRQALACAVLQLTLLPPAQFLAWTLNLSRPPLNVFLAGDNAEFRITGRIYAEHVRTEERSRLYVEIQRPRAEPARSLIDFDGLDVPRIFEQYFDRSIQLRTRFFELAADDFLIVQGLPRVDADWLAGLDAERARQRAAGSLETIEQRRYRFGCGCDARRMLLVMRGMFADRPEELFAGQPHVETRCPRCGRSWLISRAEFEADDSKLGFS